MKSPLIAPFMAGLICMLGLSLAAEPGQAQTRKPTAREIAAIRDCATRNADDLDEGERKCLFSLVADPCTGKPPGEADKSVVVDCYLIENSIWDGLLNENYKGLLETLDTTCRFYDDKIRGSMSVTMHAACVIRESARRAMLLKFFSRL